MRPTLAILLVAGLVATGSPAVAASEGAIALEICGRLVEHRPATAAAAGRLVIGTRAYTVTPDTVAGNGGVEVAVGRDLCVTAAQGRTSGQLLRYLFFAMPRGPVCGTVLALRGTAVHIRADFGLLILARAGVPEPRPGERVCYVTAVSADGDLAATATDPVDTTLEREWAWHCGTVRLYQPATAAADGSITVGSETFAIARGTAYTGDPAGDRTDRTAVGQNMCLRGVRGPEMALIEYLTAPMTSTTAATVYEYAPPSGGGAGLAFLTIRSGLTLRIPSAIDAATDVVRSHNCFSVGVDAAGDMTATGIVPCDPGRAAGPGTTTAPPAASSIGTPSAAPATQTATAPPTAAPVAAASPSPGDPTATADDAAPPLWPLALAGAAVALAAVLGYVAYSRRS